MANSRSRTLCCFRICLAAVVLPGAGCSRQSPPPSAGQTPAWPKLAIYLLVDRQADAGEPFDSFVADFEKDGRAPQHHIWLRFEPEGTAVDAQREVVAHRDGSTYVLVSTARDRCIDEQAPWAVQSLQYQRIDQPPEGTLYIELDDRGGALVHDLTSRFVGRKLTLCLNGSVRTIATIRSPIQKYLLVTGDPERMDREFSQWKR